MTLTELISIAKIKSKFSPGVLSVGKRQLPSWTWSRCWCAIPGRVLPVGSLPNWCAGAIYLQIKLMMTRLASRYFLLIRDVTPSELMSGYFKLGRV